MAVRAGRDVTCSSCLAHVVERKPMDVGNFEKKSKKVERVTDGRSDALFRSSEHSSYLSYNVMACQSFGFQDLVVEYSAVL
jgi:hypothetical protein